MRERMRDAEFPTNIQNWSGIVGGYLGGGNQAREWSAAEWGRFRGNKKLPIFVRTTPGNPGAWSDAVTVVSQLYQLKVPKQVFTALDLEGQADPVYVTNYGNAMHYFGFNVLVYGSASTVFGNPPLDGYWVADYINPPHPFEYPHADVATTQYRANVPPGYDSSTVRWAYQLRKWWI